MKYEISVSDHNTYLHVRVNEPVTAELLKDFIGKTAEKAKECGIDNFLFDLRHAHSRTNLSAHYEMVYKQSQKLGFKPQSKHALVVSQKDRVDYSFVETILINANYKSKIFTEELSAIEWLEK
ncbi:hypothetical protein ACFL2O_09050 [Thermodesulfobacteriota bacterium]